jgi:nitrate reductase beta subunit
MRIPLEYLADLFAAGDPAPVKEALSALVVMRRYKRYQQIHGEDAAHAMVGAGVDPARLDRLFRLLALSERRERFVIPTARYETAQPRPLSSRLHSPEGDRAGEGT